MMDVKYSEVARLRILWLFFSNLPLPSTSAGVSILQWVTWCLAISEVCWNYLSLVFLCCFFLCSIVITIIRIILGTRSLSKQTKDTNFCWNYWTTRGMPQICIVWVDLAVLCCSSTTIVESRQRCCITCNFLYWLLIFSFLRALFMLLWYFALVISHRPKELKVKISNKKMHIYIYGFIFW